MSDEFEYNNYSNEAGGYQEPKAETPAEPGMNDGARVDGEYRFSRPAWSDAGYVPSEDAAAMPKTYHCGAVPEKKEKKPKKARKGARAAGLAAACLVCAILGGAAGGYAVPKLLDRSVPAETAVIGPATEYDSDGAVISVAAPAAASQITRTVVTGGQELTPTEIYYNLAVNQTVAITTEITYTNVWGYTTSGAVKGSGFILSPDGYILTNFHVIEDAVKGGYDIQVLMYDGTEYTASVVGYAEDNDVAVLKIDAAGLSAVTVGDSDSLLVGEPVYAVGNPLGELEYTMTDGMVSATDREITTSESGSSTTISMFQISAAINSGNSGGPVYNSRGEVVGIATAKYSSTGVEGLGFAIPINDAVAIANDLITDGYVRGRAYMGISVGTVTASAAQYYGLVEGAIVAGVEEGSCADAAGLRESDIIVAMDGAAIASREDLIAVKKDYHAGDTATLRVYRSGEYLDLTITFDEEIPSAGDDAGSQSDSRQQQQQQQSGDGYSDYFNYFFGGGSPFGR